MYRSVHIFLLFLLLPCFSFAQKKLTDSLENRLRTQEMDTNRVKTLNRLSETTRSSDTAKTVRYAEEAMKLSLKLHYTRGELIAYQEIAGAYQAVGRIDEAMKVCERGIRRAMEEKAGRTLGALTYRMGYIYFVQGKYGEAIPLVRRSTQIADSLQDWNLSSAFYRVLGQVYAAIGEHALATENYVHALKSAEKIGDKQQVAYGYIMLGNSQQNQKDLDKALVSFRNALDLLLGIRDDYGIAGSYISIGNIFLFKNQLDSADKYYQLCLALRRKNEDMAGIAAVNEDLANVMLLKHQPEKALTYYEDGLSIFQSLSDQNGIAGSYVNRGNAYLDMKRYKDAEQNFLAGLNTARGFNGYTWIRDAYSGLSKLYAATSDYKKAYLYKDSLQEVDSLIVGQEHAAQSKEMEAKYESQKKEEEIRHLNEVTLQQQQVHEQQLQVQKKQQQIIIAVSIGFGIVLVLSFFLFRLSAERRKANLRLADQNKLIAEKNKDITDSIAYARKIQQSVMPDQRLLQQTVSEYFIFNRPRDIVSGDFFWVAQKDDRLYVAVADCTGHGVPGALVSVVGLNVLNKIIEQPGSPSPSEVLELLHVLVISALNKDKAERETKDGMDIGLLCIDRKAGKAFFSGAGRPLYYSNANGLTVIKGNRYSIAGEKKQDDAPFSEQAIELNGRTCFYLSSDGFVDQFGEATGKKYLSRHFQEFLSTITTLPMQEQHQRLDKEFAAWKGSLDQVDDVLVLGVTV